jgi:thiamine biosynthesis lipoprotein
MSRKTTSILAITLAIALAAALAALALMAAQSWHKNDRESAQEEFRKFSLEFFDTFDTLVSFTAFAKNEAEFQEYAKIFHDEMVRLHRLFDVYNSYEGLINMKTLNDNAGGVPLHVDPAIAALLETAKDAYEDTEGAVNVALGPVLAVWHDLRERASAKDDVSIPTPAELSAAAFHVSVHDVVIDQERSTVFLRYNDMRLDVGALGKGFAVQSAVELLRASGLKSGLINAGGNVAVIGTPLDGRETWSIGVRAPNGTSEKNELLDILYLSEGAVVTSGNDQRYFTVAGRRYHHIIDPQTLYPANGVNSVTVLHPNSTTADILSTAAFILPIDKARPLIARHGAEAIWLLSNGTKFATPGYLRLSQLVSPK